MNNNELIKKYMDIYQNSYFKGNYRKEFRELTKELINYKDRLSILNPSFMEFMLEMESKATVATDKYAIDELIVILDKKRLPFDNHYCYCINTIMKALSYSKLEINNKELMELSLEFTKMRYGFESYFSESKDFRNHLQEVINLSSIKPKDLVIDYLSFIIAHLYYNSLDKGIVYDTAITFMCNYEEILDKFRINGFSIIDDFNSEYFELFINTILSVNNKKKIIKRNIV